jgi:hypothetical protein
LGKFQFRKAFFSDAQLDVSYWGRDDRHGKGKRG